MEEQHQEILRRHRVLLRREISADRIATDLFSARIFDKEDLHEVQHGETIPERKADTLLDIIPHRGPNAFSWFCRSLKNHQQHLADKILTPFSEMTLQDGESFSAAGLPCFPKSFTGRKQLLKEIISKIKDLHYRLLLLVGPPGYGKSSLAVVIGHTLEKEDLLVLYFELKDITTMYGASVFMLETLQRVPSNDPVRQLLQYLRSQLQRETVLILDNTEDLQANESRDFFEFLKKVGEFSVNVHTIVTTTQAIGRIQLLPFYAQSFPLEPLDEKETEELWKKLNPDNTYNESNFHMYVCQLCKTCMGIPLFLEVAASHVQQGTDIVSLIKDLDSSPEVLLQEEEIAIKMKVFLSRIPSDLKITLTKLAVFPGSYFYNEAKFLFVAAQEFTFRDRLVKLCDYSLVKFNKDTGTYNLHNVVQSAVSKARLDDTLYQEYNNAVVQFVEHYMNILREMNVQFISHDNMKALQTYSEQKRNILHAFSLATDYKLVQAVDVSTEMVHLLAKCMNIREFEKVYEGMAEIVKDDDKRYSDCLTSLGFKNLCHHGRDNTDTAKRYLTEACELQELCQATDTMERAHAMSKLGLCKAMSGEIEAGVCLIAKAINIRKRLVSREDDIIKNMLLGGGYCDLAMAISSYNIKVAVKIWEHTCLTIYQQILNTHPFTATLHQYIGDGYHKQGQFEQAAEHKQRSLDMRKSLLGEYHQDTARSYSSLAQTLEALGQPLQAVEMLRKTLHVQARGSASHEDVESTIYEIQRLEELINQDVGR